MALVKNHVARVNLVRRGGGGGGRVNGTAICSRTVLLVNLAARATVLSLDGINNFRILEGRKCRFDASCNWIIDLILSSSFHVNYTFFLFLFCKLMVLIIYQPCFKEESV